MASRGAERTGTHRLFDLPAPFPFREFPQRHYHKERSNSQQSTFQQDSLLTMTGEDKPRCIKVSSALNINEKIFVAAHLFGTEERTTDMDAPPQHIGRLLAYNAWANRETLASLKSIDASPPPLLRPLKFMAHIIAAESLWLNRLRPDQDKVVVWPELTLAQCEAQHSALEERWQKYLSGLDAGKLLHQITYTNSKNEPWTSMIEDVLLHVVMHSTYHRGQIASDLRASGFAPAYTDFIHSVRQGFLR